MIDLARCSRCGCPAADHEVDDEERRGCTECECLQYEAPPVEESTYRRAGHHPAGHHPTCPGPGQGCTLDGGSPAAIARRRGWGVGTELEGDEGWGVTQIRITALGEQAILARREPGPELLWALNARCWGLAGGRNADGMTRADYCPVCKSARAEESRQ